MEASMFPDVWNTGSDSKAQEFLFDSVHWFPLNGNIYQKPQKYSLLFLFGIQVLENNLKSVLKKNRINLNIQH